MDELEAAENAKSYATVEAQVAGAADVIDWNEVFADIPSEWLDSVISKSSSGVARH
jgi:hypothetical protein